MKPIGCQRFRLADRRGLGVLLLGSVFAAAFAVAFAAMPARAQAPADVSMHVFQGGTSLKDFARAVGGAGDVNADGFADIIVGVPDTLHDLAIGAATVYSGRDGSVLLALAGSAAGDKFGRSVAGIGDVNGDGHDDVLIGGANGASVFSGADGALLYQYAGGSPSSGLGAAVAGLGDLDGDGVRDFIIGAPGWSSSRGVVALFSGATGGLLLTLPGAQAGSSFGSAVADAGDVNADGRDDFVVGFNDGILFIGLAAAYSGVNGSLLHSWSGTSKNAGFGGSVGGAGDVDGDGYADVIVGAPQSSIAFGYAQVFSGKTGAVLYTFNGTDYGTDVLGRFGWRVGGIGDVNQDGHADVFVSAPGAAFPGTNTGHVFLYSGATGNLITSFAGATGFQLGTSAAAAGDVNGDGRIDLVAGSPDADILAATGHDGIAEVHVLSLPWNWLGGGLSGTHAAPILSAAGTLTPNSAGSLSLAGALESGSASLVVGLGIANVPFKGGVMVPTPDVVAAGLPISAAGSLVLPFTWPAGVPAATTAYLQMWIADAGGVHGFSASNGISGTAP